MMKISLYKVPENEIPENEILDIQDFAERHRLVMDVIENNSCINKEYKYGASFNETKLVRGNFLQYFCGYGSTIEAAISKYASDISLKIISVNGKEIQVPHLISSKTLHITPKQP